MYEPNDDIDDTGAEAGEFVDTPTNEPGSQEEPGDRPLPGEDD